MPNDDWYAMWSAPFHNPKLIGENTVPYTVVDDGDIIQVRASITDRIELKELIDKLQQRLDGKHVNITTEEKPDDRG